MFISAVSGGRARLSDGPARGGDVTILQKLFTRKPTQRVRICVECGMPIAEHKEWCSILRTQQEMANTPRTPAPSPRT
jgi:hypothetical protein